MAMNFPVTQAQLEQHLLQHGFITNTTLEEHLSEAQYVTTAKMREFISGELKSEHDALEACRRSRTASRLCTTRSARPGKL